MRLAPTGDLGRNANSLLDTGISSLSAIDTTSVQRVIRLASQRMRGAARTTTGNIATHEKRDERTQCDTNVPSATNCMLAIADATADVKPA